MPNKPMTFSESTPLDAISSTALHAYPPRPCKALLIGIGALGLVLGAASQVEAQSVPQILSVPANSTPPVPAGLKVTCTLGPGTGQPSPNCPVILYGGVRTWAYSFIDNRLAFGVVSFDPNGNILKNVTRNGARYVYKMTVDPIAQAVSSSNCQRLGPVQCQNRYRLARPAGDPTPGRHRASQLLATGSQRFESHVPERSKHS
jgi:hypothetical protein